MSECWTGGAGLLESRCRSGAAAACVSVWHRRRWQFREARYHVIRSREGERLREWHLQQAKQALGYARELLRRWLDGTAKYDPSEVWLSRCPAAQLTAPQLVELNHWNEARLERERRDNEPPADGAGRRT